MTRRCEACGAPAPFLHMKWGKLGPGEHKSGPFTAVKDGAFWQVYLLRFGAQRLKLQRYRTLADLQRSIGRVVAEWPDSDSKHPESARVKSEVELHRSECKPRGEDYLVCTTQGIMTTRSLYTKKQSERGFSCEATLVKVPRGARTPDGLLLADFENQYHELGEASAGRAALDRAGIGAKP